MVGDILQPTHLIFVLIVALLVLGPKRLPEVARTLGNGIRDFRSAISGEETSPLDDGQTTRLPPDYTPDPPVPADPLVHADHPVEGDPPTHAAAPTPPAVITEVEPESPAPYKPEPAAHEPAAHEPEPPVEPDSPVAAQAHPAAEPATEALPAEPPPTDHSEPATTEQRPA